MGFVARGDYSAGWQPDADAVNAPPTALLRADNLIHDERHVLALRAGSAKINGVAFADTDVHSLFTTALSGTRYRMAGANNSVYANGTAIQTGIAGSDDIAFGFHLGQILFARSTTKKKFDGTTVRNWGIAMTGAKPTAVAIDPDGKVLATCASGETPAFEKLEGGGPAGVVYSPNHYQPTDPLYNPVGAIQIEMAATNRAVYEKEWMAPQDFTVYTSGGTGTDDDRISCYLYVNDPKLLKSFSIQVDVNDGTFLEDWYQSPQQSGLLPTKDDALAAARTALANVDTDPWSFGILDFPDEFVRVLSASTGLAAGWMKVSWRRGDFVRSGNTYGKDWSTVKAVRIHVESHLPTLVVRVENIRFYGGALTGPAQWRYVYVRNASGYLALSAPSPVSDEELFSNQDATITIPADASRDSQVNEIWLYRDDLKLDTFYRVSVKTGVSGTGGYSITDRMRPEEALTINLKLELTNTTPPDNIIGIVGPHYDRTLVLTSGGQLWPSRRLDPDAFATDQALNVAGTDETCYWIFRALSDVFIGTSKDIYRLEGTGAELPDGTIDFAIRPLSMDHRPLNAGVAHEGNQVCFFSDDGWRATDGGGSALLTGVTSELYRGKTRHGVSPVNVSGGRFRAALAHGHLVAITPEGASTTSSTILYRYVFARQQWYRHPYVNAGGWRSIYREPDGTLIAGDAAGFVWVLDTGTQDEGTNIAVTLWTKVDDLGLPYQRKKIGELQWRSETGGQASTLAVHLNGSSVAATTLTATQSAMATNAFDLGNVAGGTAIAICKHLQVRLTGSFPSFHLYEWAAQFRERPIPLIARVVETLGGSPGRKRLSGFQLKCCTLGVARTLTPILDGVADAETFTFTTDAEEPESVTLRFTVDARKAVDVAFAVDGEIEIDSWAPIVSHREPLGVKVWDSGPIFDAPKERRWVRAVEIKVRAGADLVVTPFFDGREFSSVTMRVTGDDVDAETVYLVPVGRAYVGKQPRIRVTSCEPFYPYWVRCLFRDSGAPSMKPKQVAPMTLETAT